MKDQQPISKNQQQPKLLIDELGDTLRILNDTLIVARGRSVHAGQAAGCLELLELQAKLVELGNILRQTDKVFEDPVVKEWMSDKASVPF